ncbi:hypothetical protein AAMO2058_000830700 [Amorphochlora amoebiformis]
MRKRKKKTNASCEIRTHEAYPHRSLKPAPLTRLGEACEHSRSYPELNWGLPGDNRISYH